MIQIDPDPTPASVPARPRIPKMPKLCLRPPEFPNRASVRPNSQNGFTARVRATIPKSLQRRGGGARRGRVPKITLYGSVSLVGGIYPFSGAITLPVLRSALCGCSVTSFCECLLYFGRWGIKSFPALPPF
jgi:hypothetical protein